MLRLLLWLAGAIGLCYLCYKFAAWRVALQLGLVVALFLWVVCGGFLIAHRAQGNARTRAKPATDSRPVIWGQNRAEFVARYGEDAAAAWEKAGRRPWEAHDWSREASK